MRSPVLWTFLLVLPVLGGGARAQDVSGADDAAALVREARVQQQFRQKPLRVEPPAAKDRRPDFRPGPINIPDQQPNGEPKPVPKPDCPLKFDPCDCKGRQMWYQPDPPVGSTDWGILTIGKIAEDELHKALEKCGYKVTDRQMSLDMSRCEEPFYGVRIIDLLFLDLTGKKTCAIEAKANEANYNATQKAKDDCIAKGGQARTKAPFQITHDGETKKYGPDDPLPPIETCEVHVPVELRYRQH